MVILTKLLPSHLPPPNNISLDHMEKVVAHIENKTTLHQGMISFSKFMEYCLYAPGLGYYSAGATKLGKEGDFITAPEISPLFAKCIARKCLKFMAASSKNIILEFGAGTGKMAADILLELEKHQSLPLRYLIVEVSAELKERQNKTLADKCPWLLPRVEWLNQLPQEKISAIILANEVLDAMPVNKFYWDQKKLYEYYVAINNGCFEWILAEPSQDLINEFNESIYAFVKNENNYESEVNLRVGPWLKAINHFITDGDILIFDYGFLDEVFYHPQRNSGTIMCHYQHHAHDNPLVLPGLQDITSHVNFSQLIREAEKNGFAISQYQTQADFLIEQGITDMVEPLTQEIEQYKQAQALKYLLLPTEMGEIFKVLTLKKS
jgi:SAM-dependent MidA family methyltransferase